MLRREPKRTSGQSGRSSTDRSIALLAVAAFVSMASLRACDALLPELAREFGSTTGLAARAVTVYAITYGLAQVFYGPLGDRYGKYRVVSGATLACALGSFGAAWSGSLGSLLFWRAITAAGGAAIVPLSMAWIGDTVPYERRQTTLAHFITGTITGTAAGPFISGLCADRVGWRWAFGILAGLFLAVGAGLVAEVRRAGTAHVEAGPSAVTAYFERIRGVVRIPWARRVFLLVFLEGLTYFGALTFVPSYLHERFGVSLAGGGGILGVCGLGGLSYTFLARRLVQSLGERGLAAVGGLIVGFAFVLVAVGPSWAWALPATFLAGLGFYGLHNTLQTNATQMAPAARGTAVTLFACSLFMGQSIGVTAGAALLDQAGARYLFICAAAGMPAIGAWFSRGLGRRPALGH